MSTTQITADEARQKAISVNTELENSQYTKIMSEIKNAVDKGRYQISFTDLIQPNVKSKLEGLGYIVSDGTYGRDEYTTYIKW